MTKRTMQELRSMTTDDLLKQLEELRAEFRQVRTKIATGGAVGKPAEAKKTRRRIARVQTLLSERRLGIRATSG